MATPEAFARRFVEAVRKPTPISIVIPPEVGLSRDAAYYRRYRELLDGRPRP